MSAKTENSISGGRSYNRSGAAWRFIGLVGMVGLLITGYVRSPAAASSTQSVAGEQDAVLAGGCFWGVDGVFKHVKGVISVTSGYSGGSASTAQYETVSTGTTGHAESVKIVYDPSKISYQQLLKVFFFVAHDPTELNHQGPDTGTQYRSIIFYTDEEQKKIAENYIAELDRRKAFPGSDSYRSRAAEAVLPGRGLPSEFSRTVSRQPLHCIQRSAEARSTAQTVSVTLQSIALGMRCGRGAV